MKTLNFRPDQVWGELLLNWWHGLKTDTGGRAALRRAPDITAVVLLPAYQLTLSPKNVPLAECFNASKENGNDEDSAGALHAGVQA